MQPVRQEPEFELSSPILSFRQSNIAPTLIFYKNDFTQSILANH